MQIAVLYGSTEGHTAHVAAAIEKTLQDSAQKVDIHHVQAIPQGFDLTQYDGIIVGASIHAGTYQNYVIEWVHNHLAVLQNKPSAFFSVCLTQKETTLESQEEVRGYIETFKSTTGWQPEQVGSFAGALPFTRYGFFKRWMMKRIIKQKDGDEADTSRDYIYTDWDDVSTFAIEFVKRIQQGIPA